MTFPDQGVTGLLQARGNGDEAGPDQNPAKEFDVDPVALDDALTRLGGRHAQQALGLGLGKC